MEKLMTVAVAIVVAGALVALAGCTGGSASCDDLKDQSSRNKCYYDKAVADKTPDLCARITSTAQQRECQDKAKP